MPDITDEQFDALITRAMDELPQDYIRNLQNVAIIMEDDPSPEQRVKMKLDQDHLLLLGLFEGVPKTLGPSLLPSKITLFKHPILAVSRNESELFEQVKRTLWHEMAHYYGLSHADMDARQH